MNIKRKFLTGFILATAVLYVPANIANAQIGDFPGGANNAAAELFSRTVDGKIHAVIRVKIDSGWHLYDADKGHPKAIGLEASITMGPESVKWSRVMFPKPHRLPQPPELAGPGVWINSHEGTIILYASGEASGDVRADSVTVKIDAQTCSDTGSCTLYTESLKSMGRGDDALFAAFPTKFSAADATANKPAAKPASDDTTDYSKITFPDYAPRNGGAGGHGLAVWLLIAFLAGILMNVMPCVLPVISIKVLSFVQQAGESRGRVLALGGLFAAGMILVFWALAIAAITLGLNWGEQFQSDGFMIVMIAVVFAFALSLLDVFTLGVPKQVNTLAAGMGREGLSNAFFNGMLATLLATPCSGPFLGTTLTWTLAQTPMTIFLIFTMLGFGMALPYVVLTAFPKLLAFVPKPGPWMETFKQAMGFLLMVTVVYLMISVRREMLLFINAFLVFVAIAAWYWGRFAKFGQKFIKRWAVVAVTVAIVAIGAHLSFDTMQAAFAPTQPGQGHLEWEEFDRDAFDEHMKAGRSVFIDFSASWCPNCVWNEKVVFESAEISELLKKKGVVSMRADITHDSPRTRMLERLRAKLGGRSLPFLAVFPADKPNEPFVRPDIVTIGTMREILSSLPDPKPSE
jgi:suppressor for copper-sensitivity B